MHFIILILICSLDQAHKPPSSWSWHLSCDLQAAIFISPRLSQLFFHQTWRRHLDRHRPHSRLRSQQAKFIINGSGQARYLEPDSIFPSLRHLSGFMAGMEGGSSWSQDERGARNCREGVHFGFRGNCVRPRLLLLFRIHALFILLSAKLFPSRVHLSTSRFVNCFLCCRSNGFQCGS